MLLDCHSYPSVVQEIDPGVMTGAKIGYELNIWVREVGYIHLNHLGVI